MKKTKKAKEEKQKKPSAALIRALLIIRDKKPWSAANFALEMWPDALMHRTHSRGGRGTQTGKAAWLCAGSYLARLKKSGWISVNYSWMRKNGIEPVAYLTHKGDDLLREYGHN